MNDEQILIISSVIDEICRRILARLQADLVCFNAAIGCCARAAAWHQAVAVLEDLQGRWSHGGSCGDKLY